MEARMEINKEVYKEVAVKRYCFVYGAVEHLSNGLLIDTCSICGLPLCKVVYYVNNTGTVFQSTGVMYGIIDDIK